MSIRKERIRFSGIADLEEQAIKLFHIFKKDFPGISFEYKAQMPGKKDVSKKTIIDHRGKLRLDQNDGTHVPDAQILEIIHGVEIAKQIDNVVNEPEDKERNTESLTYDELTRWKFRKGQHKTLYLNYEAKLSTGTGGSIKITITDGTNPVIYEETGVTSSWVEYTDSKDISSLDDGWCEIILEAKVPLAERIIYTRTFTISIRRT